jgi:hypothetical protein
MLCEVIYGYLFLCRKKRRKTFQIGREKVCNFPRLMFSGINGVIDCFNVEVHFDLYHNTPREVHLPFMVIIIFCIIYRFQKFLVRSGSRRALEMRITT